MKTHFNDPDHRLDSVKHSPDPNLIIGSKKDKIILALKVIVGLSVIGTILYYLLIWGTN